MAIDPQTTDTVTIPQLDPLTLALETFLVGANADGKMGNFTADDLANFIAPYISALGSSPFVANTGNPLPNPIDKTTAITFVGPGDFDQTTGANVVTTEELNVLFWSSNGVTGSWVLGVEVPIDLSGYATIEQLDLATEDIPSIKEKTDNLENYYDEGYLNFIDEFGNVIERISANGTESIRFISDNYQIGVNTSLKDTPDYIEAITDEAGNIVEYVDLNGRRVSIYTPSTNNKLFNLKVSVLGDSMSTADYAGLTIDQVYHHLLATKYNWQLHVDAVSGSPVGGTRPDRFTTRIGNLGAEFVPDVILIFGSTNDFGQWATPLGVIGDPVSDSTFYGALKNLFAQANALYKYSKIYFMLPIHAGNTGNFPEQNTTTNNYLYQYVQAIREVANIYGVSIIDTWQDSGITRDNMNSAAGGYLSPVADRLHPNYLGHQLISRCVENYLINKY